MGSLLDRVLTNKDNPAANLLLNASDDRCHQLPDGSTIYDSTIAAINRILVLNPHLHKRPTGSSAHPYQLYDGHTPVNLTDKRAFLTLVKADWTPRTPYQTILVERYIMKCVPTFSRNCIVISEGLIWDREAGVLRNIKKDEKVRTVS